MKFISWNVNGLRACLQKGFEDFFIQSDADFFCLQETKLQAGQVDLQLRDHQYWDYAQKKGYSGTAIFAKHEPLSVKYGLGIEELDQEGRCITLEYPNFYLVNCYTPNAQDGLKRLDHRMAWDDAYRAHLQALDANKPVIACADFNVAHQEIDLKNPGPNRGNAGFSDEERAKFTELLAAGFTDSFRFRNPDAKGCTCSLARHDIYRHQSAHYTIKHSDSQAEDRHIYRHHYLIAICKKEQSQCC